MGTLIIRFFINNKIKSIPPYNDISLPHIYILDRHYFMHYNKIPEQGTLLNGPKERNPNGNERI
jgi:hypothetical protein